LLRDIFLTATATFVILLKLSVGSVGGDKGQAKTIWILQRKVVNIHEITAYVRSQQSSWKFGVSECILIFLYDADRD